MKPKWIIQSNSSCIDSASFATAISQQNMEVEQISHSMLLPYDFSKQDPSKCTICYGDIDFVQHMHKTSRLYPGAWCTFKNLKCSTYYTYFGKYLINQNYIMLPLGELARRWTEITNNWFKKDCFVRPDSGTKPFPGHVVAKSDRHKIQWLADTVGGDLMVVVAPAKSISTEYRFVICNKMVVAGCQYLPTQSSLYGLDVLRLAREIGSNPWQPDSCYTIDIAECDGKLLLLEINSFSCAGLYDCYLPDVISFVSSAAILEWQDLFEE